MDGYDDEEMETAERTILDVGLGRHGVPLPSNGEVGDSIHGKNELNIILIVHAALST